VEKVKRPVLRVFFLCALLAKGRQGGIGVRHSRNPTDRHAAVLLCDRALDEGIQGGFLPGLAHQMRRDAIESTLKTAAKGAPDG
jgi:hypothetical protein